MTRIMVPMKQELMLGEHDAYHHNIKGDEAKRRLEECDNDCYLTRYSDNYKTYMLTVSKRQYPTNVIAHFTINVERGGKCNIEGKEECFDTIEDLLSHYEIYGIDPAIDKIGQPYTEKAFKENQEKKKEIEVLPEEKKNLKEKPEEMKKPEEEIKKLKKKKMHLEKVRFHSS